MLRTALLLLIIAVPLGAQDLSDVMISLMGTVTGPDKKPIKGATVKAVPWDDTHRVGWHEVDKAPAFKVKKDGKFWLERKRRKWLVVAAAPRHAELALIMPAEDRLDIEFRLPKAKQIVGVVLDARKRPIRNAGLLLMREDDSLEGPIPRDGIKASSDKRGRFVFDRLAPGEFRITVRLRGLVTEYIHDVEAGTKKLRVVMKEGKRLRGRVLDKDGKPVVGRVIQFNSKRDNLGIATTDAEGRFLSSLLHVDRTYRIGVYSRDRGSTVATVEAAKPGDEEITIKLE